MSNRDIALMAHLLRRAGFGATRAELEEYVAKGYDAVVEELLHPENPDTMPEDIIRRYHSDQLEMRKPDAAGANWMYRMITTKCPLEEKMAFFWHSLLATGYTKLNQTRSLLDQIEMFRQHGLGSFHAMLVAISKDPAMILWLDNNDNHKGAKNENFGRELLELFSMGVGNYTEDDIKEASRAFTGWTLGNVEYMSIRAQKDAAWPYGRIAWHFGYRDYDHDDGEKVFLGETGRFNGEDIIDIIVRQEATARFLSTRLFLFFSADEVDEEGEKVVKAMMRTYFDSGYEIRAVMRTLFQSDYFKSEKARFARMKAPVEVVVGAVRQAGTYRWPDIEVNQLPTQARFMGQGLLQPPSVEGWHEGVEWINSGALVERVNFAAKELGNVDNPGVQVIIERLAADNGGTLSPEEQVEKCLDLLGPVVASEATLHSLVEFASRQGDLDLRNRRAGDDVEKRVADLLRLVASTREYQLA